jgi:hypothetical protein
MHGFHVIQAGDFFAQTWLFLLTGVVCVLIMGLFYLIASRICPSKRRLKRKVRCNRVSGVSVIRLYLACRTMRLR